MLCDDQDTFHALNLLESTVQQGDRPLVIWLGAGVGAWAGYPLWKELATKMHSRFSREAAHYDKTTASSLLNQAAYPRLFQLMRESDDTFYFNLLQNEFVPKQPRPVYRRLLRVLNRIVPTFVLTTNVDEVLEQNLAGRQIVQRSDVERIPQLLFGRIGFVGKLHGSISSINSLVFSEEDYLGLEADIPYMNALNSIFSTSTVLFLGYGLQDEHVISALKGSSRIRPVFGAGPHFIVSPVGGCAISPNVRRISYVDDPSDHRGALLVLEAAADSMAKKQLQGSDLPIADAKNFGVESVYFISDLFPPGQWTTSQTADIRGVSDSETRQLITGEGYVDGEVILHDYSALHDVVVGLICFDVICLTIDNLGRLHGLLGSSTFWTLVEAGAIRLVAPPPEPAVIFQDPQAVVGDLGAFHLGSRSSSFESFGKITISELIRKQIQPRPGLERVAEFQMARLESRIIDLRETLTSDQLSFRTRSALMHPSIRRLLGFSPGTPRGSVPRWVVFPILRLAGVIRKGIICQHLKARATRMIFGSERLASAAFSAAAGTEWADNAASYALTGRFNSDLGRIIESEPSLWSNILSFRDSPAGAEFRCEISERLMTDEGGQVSTAINAGLGQAVPSSVLQRARDQLSGLFTPRNVDSQLVPAVWGDLRNSEERIAGWRRQSKSLLDQVCAARNIGPYDDCPCGSGEKTKFCCSVALR